MKTLPLIFCFLAGCGLVFNSDEKTVNIAAPAGSVIYVDGIPVGSPGPIVVENHRDHIVTAKHPDGTTLSCSLDSHVRVGYAVADFLLFSTVVPLVVDAVTGDWSSVSQNGCVL